MSEPIPLHPAAPTLSDRPGAILPERITGKVFGTVPVFVTEELKEETMACCSQETISIKRSADGRRSAVGNIPSTTRRLRIDSQPRFQYTGDGHLTVAGPRSGKRYRFDRPGAAVTIDARDARALAGVTALRQVVGEPRSASLLR